ncbi:MAG TPA: PEP/pyruvate-binding domain-containing protein [Polyangiaceae bacterium]|nr:PEP/pyruvate-binding domain-containing protein [Polyangiaceae bacterium]
MSALEIAARSQKSLFRLGLALVCGSLAACSNSADGNGATTTVVEGVCNIDPSEIMDGTTSTQYLERIDCSADFRVLGSEPIDASIPGARSVKVILDTADSNHQYFQNSVLYKVHYDFASTHLSGNGLPVVPSLAEFNTSQYYQPDRRFVLGAVTYYDGPKVWALELAPYDTASASMMEALFRSVKSHAFFGPALKFHPTSDAVALEAAKLPKDIQVVTTDELYQGINYQPLVLSTGVGRLRFETIASIDEAAISYTDIVVVDSAPNDIPVVQGLISQDFQTPLSHVNVLSANRKTPNMGLRGAMTDPTLRDLEGKLVSLTVGALGYDVHEVSEAEAETFWNEHKPNPVTLPEVDTEKTELKDIADVTPEPESGGSLRDAIKTAVLSYGGKAAQYSVLARTPGVPVEKAFAIPVYWYYEFMERNGLFDKLARLQADKAFQSDSQVRFEKLAEFQADVQAGTVSPELEHALMDKIESEYPNHVIRFRTSTNSEDLDGFPCAGCYDSAKGDPAKGVDDVLDAIKFTYSTVWKFRTFEERAYYSVDHHSVGMALLVHNNFPDEYEKANGVAITANPFDESGLEPAFYVNVQFGGKVEVVAPPAGTTSDQILYFFDNPNQPITYLAHSNIISGGSTVLSRAQVHSLGVALDAIHTRFSAAYGPAAGNKGFYAMDIEFKFSNEADPTKPATLFVKQARPYPGRGN